MRILLIMNPGISVPPVLYGGIERIVYLLAEEYHKMGHEVTLLAGTGSYCSGSVVTFGSNKHSKWEEYKEINFVWRYLGRNHRHFDLVHNFGRLVYFLPILNKPIFKMMSYQRPVSVKGIKLISSLPSRGLIFTGCSNYCVSTGNVAGKWEMVYNAIDFAQHKLNELVDDDAPLMFLGRLDRVKGVHTAIEVAKKTNNQLVIGGNIPDTPDNYEYFKKEIEPLFDGKQIVYLGELNDREKNHYLKQAKALLFPIEWDEPFGIVMIEAMAYGTPVIAFNRGAVPEVVNEGVTGNIVNTIDEMSAAILNIKNISRYNCRLHAMQRFNIDKIADSYLGLFHNDLN